MSIPVNRLITKYLVALLSFIFLSAIAPAQTVTVIAHRGASSLAPENTMAAFQKAIDLGADYLELDVWNSYDDSLMVIHDNTIDRTTNGTGTVTALRYSQLIRWDAGSWFAPEFTGEHIPTLRQVLTLVKEKNAKACIEVKNTNITANVVQLVTEMGLIGQTYICCFYLDALVEAKNVNSQASLLYYVDPVTLSAIDAFKAAGGKVIGSGNGNTQESIDYAHQQGLQFWPWTIDDSVSMVQYIGKNVDGIITNYAQVLLSIVKPPASVPEYRSGQFPERLQLSVYPNPFNPSTTVLYAIDHHGPVTISVYDMLGRTIATLVDQADHPAGNFSAVWNASGASSGTYIIRLRTEQGSKSLHSAYIR